MQCDVHKIIFDGNISWKLTVHFTSAANDFLPGDCNFKEQELCEYILNTFLTMTDEKKSSALIMSDFS